MAKLPGDPNEGLAHTRASAPVMPPPQSAQDLQQRMVSIRNAFHILLSAPPIHAGPLLPAARLVGLMKLEELTRDGVGDEERLRKQRLPGSPLSE